jgi:endonuclease/exonuclease/phosphatase family metal-dependent hydrolase
VADGPKLKLSLNGIVVNECDLSLWTDAKKLPDGTAIPPWLSRPWAELDTAGKIGFQGRHGGAGVKFRNIRIRPLPAKRPLRRLMSFNIRMGCGHDGPFKLAKGSLGFLPQCAEVIGSFKPDVCCLQEVDRKSVRAGGVDQTAALAKLAGMEGSWVEKIPGYGISALYRERPFRVSKVLFKGQIHTRALMISEYSDCVVANTHFPLTKPTRLAAARTVCEALKGYAVRKPVFLTGDLNALPDSETMALLKRDFTVLSDPSAFTFPAKKPDRTIDYVMVDNAHAKDFSKAKARTFAAPGATDHVALVLDLKPADEASSRP